VIGVAGTFVLAESWRATGTAAALAAGQFAAVAIVGSLGARRLSIHLEWGRILVIAVVTSVATLVLVADLPLPARISVAVGAAVIIAFCVRVREGLRVARETLRR
jgi:hypothetical protein